MLVVVHKHNLKLHFYSDKKIAHTKIDELLEIFVVLHHFSNFFKNVINIYLHPNNGSGKSHKVDNYDLVISVSSFLSRECCIGFKTSSVRIG